MGRGSCEKRVSAMKKILFILLAVGLPVGVATLANPGDLRIGGWPAMTLLALGCFGIQWLAFVPARLLQTERFYDLTGSLTYIAVTWQPLSRRRHLPVRNG